MEEVFELEDRKNKGKHGGREEETMHAPAPAPHTTNSSRRVASFVYIIASIIIQE